MKEVVLYTACSLDHYIADQDGNIDWMFTEDLKLPNEDYNFSSFYEGVDTTIMGRGTLEKVLRISPDFPYQGKRNIVFTTSKHFEKPSTLPIEVVRQDAIETIKTLKKESGSDIWLVGGSKLNTSLLEQRLIDKIILTIVPVYLGSGKPIFETTKPLYLDMMDCQTYANGLVQLTYVNKQYEEVLI